MKLIEVEGPIIVDSALAKELDVPEILLPPSMEDVSVLTERLICRKCGHGHYWPPLGGVEGRRKDFCLFCDRRYTGEPDDSNLCTLEDMMDIST